MADVSNRAVLSGVLHGIETAVTWRLVTPGEVLPVDDILNQAVEIATGLVQDEEDYTPHWQQVVTGEIVGMAVAARTANETINENWERGLWDVVKDVLGKIDRYGYPPPPPPPPPDEEDEKGGR